MTLAAILSYLGAALKALPEVLRLFNAFVDYAKARENQGVGREQAVAEGMRLALQQLAESAEAEREATKAHAEHPNDDDGFDPEFRRD